MLAIARAIAAPPAILVVDELSHGLAPLVVAEMFEILGELKDRITMVVIEQFTERALAIADTVAVLRRGVVIHTGPVSGVTDDDLVAWYDLGGTEQRETARTGPSDVLSHARPTPSEARRS
jgi:branched-chain amino acid transport system ATP-binding protein